MFLRVAIPFSVVSGLLYFSLLAKWFIWPWVQSVGVETALPPLILAHGIRYLGVMFSIPGVVKDELPSVFTIPATWGDIAAAYLAVAAAFALEAHWSYAMILVWVFNIVGTTHFVLDLVVGRIFIKHPGYLGACFFHVTLFLPALLVVHGIIFYLLLFGV